MGEVKILNRKEFMALPAGTVYFDYRPHVGESLAVKTSGPSAEEADDFCLQNISALEIESSGSDELFARTEEMYTKGTERPLVFDNAGREGMFDMAARFAVLDKADVERLVAVLTTVWAETE